jgi:hypothetical protein
VGRIGFVVYAGSPGAGLGVWVAGLPCHAGGEWLELKSAEGVEEAVWFLQVHVVACCAGLAVAALEEEDLLGHAGGDGGGEATLTG